MSITSTQPLTPSLPLDYHKSPLNFNPLRLCLAAALLAITPLFTVGLSLALQFPSFPRSVFLFRLPSLLTPLLILIALILLAPRKPPQSAPRARAIYFICIAIAALVLLLYFVHFTMYQWWRWFSHPPFNDYAFFLSGVLAYYLQALLVMAAWLFMHDLARRYSRKWLARLSALCLPLCACALLILSNTTVDRDVVFANYLHLDFLHSHGNWIDTLQSATILLLTTIHFLYWLTIALAAPHLTRPPRQTKTTPSPTP